MAFHESSSTISDSYKQLTDYHRIVLLTDGCSSPFLAKTAISMLRYRTADVAAVLDHEQSGKTAGEVFGFGGAIPVIGSLEEAANPDALLIGIAPPGGRLPEAWRAVVLQAIGAKVDLISGLHQFLCNDAEFAAAAKASGARLIDVRKNSETETGIGSGLSPDCFRIHTVGHDCSVGKMVAAMEIQRGLCQRGIDAGFAATGQTGIMVSGAGIPIDCVVADFVNGAAERLVRQFEHHEMLLIEGQGCITHPAYSGVTLGLLHGCAPDALVMCYEATRTHVKGFGDIPLQPLSRLIMLYEQMASTRHPCRVIGLAVNSRLLDDTEFTEEKKRVSSELDLPVCDVLREGPDALVDAIISYRN